MSAFENSFTFNNLGGMKNDESDKSERNLQNTRFSGYMLSNYSAESIDPSQSVDFASSQYTFVVNGTAHGAGINGDVVDINSKLLLSNEQGRSLEKLQLQERPFVSVPYLGRGTCDPVLEHQLLQGENVSEKKSVSTIMEKSFGPYALYITDDSMEKSVSDAKAVQESALDGWVRGGSNTRTTPLPSAK
jgi:hypothetical protein